MWKRGIPQVSNRCGVSAVDMFPPIRCGEVLEQGTPLGFLLSCGCVETLSEIRTL